MEYLNSMLSLIKIHWRIDLEHTYTKTAEGCSAGEVVYSNTESVYRPPQYCKKFWRKNPVSAVIAFLKFYTTLHNTGFLLLRCTVHII